MWPEPLHLLCCLHTRPAFPPACPGKSICRIKVGWHGPLLLIPRWAGAVIADTHFFYPHFGDKFLQRLTLAWILCQIQVCRCADFFFSRLPDQWFSSLACGRKIWRSELSPLADQSLLVHPRVTVLFFFGQLILRPLHRRTRLSLMVRLFWDKIRRARSTIIFSFPVGATPLLALLCIICFFFGFFINHRLASRHILVFRDLGLFFSWERPFRVFCESLVMRGFCLWALVDQLFGYNFFFSASGLRNTSPLRIVLLRICLKTLFFTYVPGLN